MQIVRDERYYQDLIEIMDFIAHNSVKQAFSFQEDLDSLVDEIVNFSLKHRKSIYFDDENIRDLIFKGYIIPYEVDMKSMTITVLGIVKWRSTF